MDTEKKGESTKPTAQDFMDKYKKLCDETGFMISAAPQFMLRDDSTYSMVVKLSVIKLPKNGGSV